MLRKAPVLILSLIGLLFLSTPASAQITLGKGMNLSFDGTSLKAPERAARPLFASTAEVAGAQAKSTMSARTMKIFVHGGLNTTGDIGVAVGGGVNISNFLQHEEYGLKIDGTWSNAGHCGGCDAFGTVDFSVSQLAFAGAFIYNFDEMSNGWTPFAGGGIVIIRTSYSWDDEFGDLFDFDTSVTHGGIQIQGGLRKARANGKPIGVEVRVQNAGGGGFLLLGFLGL